MAAVTPGVPYFPVIVPPSTVIGRLASGAGPAEAIPFSMLGTLLGAATYLIAASISGVNTVTGLTVSGAQVALPLSANQIVEFVPASTNTAAATFNRDGLGAVQVLSNGAALVGGELIAGIPVALFYDGANYRIVGGGFIQSGTGATSETIQSIIRLLAYSVTSVGAKVDGVTNDTAAFQQAITNSAVVFVPRGTMLITQVTVSIPCHIIIEGTIKPFANPSVAGTPAILITSSDVTVEFRGGSMDGISTTYSKWNGIAAGSSTDMIENVHVFGGKFQNIAIDNTAAFAISFSAVRGGTIHHNNLKNCGVVSNVVGGGFGINGDNCEGLVISDNWGDTVGSTFVNNSCGVNCVVRDNRVKKATLYGYKGGYGNSTTVTNDAAPSTTAFTVTKNATSLRTLKVGQAVYFPRATATFPKGIIKSIVDHSTYLTITLAKASADILLVGDSVQPLDTGCLWDGNEVVYCGENGFDQNGVNNIMIRGNRILFAGEYTDVGTYAGIKIGIWVGYDPQGGNNNTQNDGVTIQGNWVQHCGGSAIQVQNSNQQNIQDNQCFDYNELVDSAGTVTPTNGGIDTGRLGAYRQTLMRVANNVCQSPNGYGIFAGFSDQMTVEGNTVRSVTGIKCNDANNLKLTGNHVYTTGNNAYGIKVSDDSAANACATVLIDRNSVYAAGTTGYCIWLSDTGASDVEIGPRNDLRGANQNTRRIQDDRTAGVTATNSGYCVSDYVGVMTNKPMRFSLDPAGTIKLAQYFSDNGTVGGARVYGFARSGTTAFEYFECVYYGSTALPTVVFTSKGSPNATQFLAAGDFTITINSPSTSSNDCIYTNNEASTVFMTLWVESFSRR